MLGQPVQPNVGAELMARPLETPEAEPVEGAKRQERYVWDHLRGRRTCAYPLAETPKIILLGSEQAAPSNARRGDAVVLLTDRRETPLLDRICMQSTCYTLEER